MKQQTSHGLILLIAALFVSLIWLGVTSRPAVPENPLPPIPPVEPYQPTGPVPSLELPFEVEFFNEFHMKAHGDTKKREEKVRRWAQQGHEIAQIWLDLYDIEDNRFIRNEKAITRLKQLAEGGDGMAQCFYATLTSLIYPSLEESAFAFWLDKWDMASGIPYCLASYASRRISSRERNQTPYWETLKETALSGNVQSHFFIASKAIQNNTSPSQAHTALCWIESGLNIYPDPLLASLSTSIKLNQKIKDVSFSFSAGDCSLNSRKHNER